MTWVVMKEFTAPRPIVYTYFANDGHVGKKAKGKTKCVIKKEIKFQDYKDCVKYKETIFKPQQRFGGELHNVFTKMVNKAAISVNDDNRKQTHDGIISYPYGINRGIIYQEEFLKM